MKNPVCCMMIASLALCGAAWAKAPLVPLLDVHFDKLTSNGNIDPIGCNRGSNPIPPTLKYYNNDNRIPTSWDTTTNTALRDPVHDYAIQENSWSSIWFVGDGPEGLGCSYQTGFTLSFWVKVPQTTSSWSDFLGFRLGSEDYTFEYNNTTGSFQMYVGPGCVLRQLSNIDSATSVPTVAGAWNHFCLVWKPYLSWRGWAQHFGEVWLNGVLVARVVPTDNANGSLSELHLGGWERRSGSTRGTSSNSSLADICLYDRSISDDDVKWLYRHVRGPIPRGREATLALHLEKGQDKVTFANNGTLTNQFTYVNGGYTITPTAGALSTQSGLYVSGWNGKWVTGDEVTGLGCSTGTGFTLSYWSKPTSSTLAWSDLFSFGLGNGTANWRHEFRNNTGGYYYYGSCTASSLVQDESNGVWHHHVLVLPAGTTTAQHWLDGSKAGTLKMNNVDTGVVRRFCIGSTVLNESGGNRTQGPVNAGLDEVGLFNFAMSDDQVAWLKTHTPSLPELGVTALARTVSGDVAWDGFTAGWTIPDTTRRMVWPAGEDAGVAATLTASADANMTVDTVVGAQLTLAGAAGTALNLVLAKDCVFAPTSLVVAAGLDVTLPVGTKVAGAFTLGENAKIKFDASQLHAGDETVLTVGSFVLPEGETDVLAHVEVTGASDVTAALGEDGTSIVLSGLVADPTRRVVTGTEVLDADADWTTYETVVFMNGAKLDLKGHVLTLAGFESVQGELSEITDTVGGGRLIVDVPAGRVVRNLGVKFTGGFQFVKNGAGKFVIYVNGSNFTGGTELNAGTVALQTNVGYSMPLGSGENRWVRINEGAVFDIAGVTDLSTVWLSLNGGTLANSQSKLGMSVMNDLTMPLIYKMRLEKDSTLDLAYSYGFRGIVDGSQNGPVALDLGGHTLTVRMKSRATFCLNNCDVSAGAIDIRSGYLCIGPQGVRAPAVSLTADASYFVGMPDSATATFKDFAALNSSNIANGWSNGVVKVSGTFTPTGTNFPHVELQDGSTLDLSGRTGTASAKSNHANGGIANYLTAVAGGTVTVNLAERADLTTLVDSANPYLVTWDGAPVPTAKFVVDAETATQGLAVRVDSTGLRLVRALFMIILR